MPRFKLNQLEGKREFDDELYYGNQQQQPQQIEPFYFIQAANTQFGLMDSPEPKWDKEIELSEAFVAACNRLRPKPKFLVVCGDFTHAMPSEMNRDAQVKSFKRIFSKLDSDIPLVCVCGNHDVGDIPTLAAIDEYKREFGEDYFYFVVNNVLFIVINSQLYENRDNVKEYAAKQDEWLEMILEKCKYFKHSILFDHIPWFFNRDYSEQGRYYDMKKAVKIDWLKKFALAGVKKIFCGHWHKNAGRWYGDMELVVTSAIGAQFGDDESGARLVKVTENRIVHEYHWIEYMPTEIELRPENWKLI